MINISKNKYKNIDFYSKWDEVINNINSENTAILLSSVIHEVYSYGHSKEIRKFWNEQIFNNKFKYAIIRDMIPSSHFEKMNLVDIKKIRQKSDSLYLAQFEKIWGSIDENFRVLLHWLLKYKYTDNWNREVNENYLPITIETLKTKIPSNWEIVFEEHYTYDFIKNQIKQDFDIELKEPTHLKMILKNKNI